MDYRKLLLLPALGALFFSLVVTGCPNEEEEDDDDDGVSNFSIQLTKIGQYIEPDTGSFNRGAAEIPAYDRASRRLFVVNGFDKSIDVISIANPAAPTLVGQIDCKPFGNGATPEGAPNSVACRNGIVAIAVEQGDGSAMPALDARQGPGEVVFFAANTNDFTTPLATYDVGAVPDMIGFTPNGRYLLVANEGEPDEDTYTNDPEGSVTIINIQGGVVGATVTTATFTTFNSQKAALIASGVRIFGPGTDTVAPTNVASVAQDLEPEYIAFNDDSLTAYVTCQENNCIAILNIATATFSQILPFGYKDHSLPGNEFDGCRNDGGYFAASWPVYGMYQPDTTKAVTINGQTYIFTANEGDARAWGSFEEDEERLEAYTLDPTAFPAAYAAFLQEDSFGIGDLNVTNSRGDTDADGDLDQIYAFGARSFSIWTTTGTTLTQVFDSGSELERVTAQAFPNSFNCNQDSNTADSRSDDKGPEPEALEIAQIDGRTFVFVGLERIGGIAVYDVTDPENPRFIQYLNTRNFGVTPAHNQGGDIGPEGMVFIPASQSPNGRHLLVVANEVSGTTAIFEITKVVP